jgi:hypothetical protein
MIESRYTCSFCGKVKTIDRYGSPRGWWAAYIEGKGDVINPCIACAKKKGLKKGLK